MTPTPDPSAELLDLWNEAVGLVQGRLNADDKPVTAPGFFDRQKLKRALRYVELMVEVAPNNPAPPFLASKIQERLGDIASCLEWAQKAYALCPDEAYIAVEYGDALGRCGRHTEAIDVLTKGAEVNPTDPRVHSRLGRELLLADRPREAVAVLERLLELEPDGEHNKRRLELAIDVAAGRKVRLP